MCWQQKLAIPKLILFQYVYIYSILAITGYVSNGISAPDGAFILNSTHRSIPIGLHYRFSNYKRAAPTELFCYLFNKPLP
jgi:hypothetical protein